MILGDEGWVKAHPEERDWWRQMRRAGRYYAANPVLWRLAEYHRPSKMTDEAYSLLELCLALHELRKHDYEAWVCIQRTDLVLPDAAGGRGRLSIAEVAELIGKSEASVYRARRRGWEWIAQKVVTETAPLILSQTQRAAG